MLTPTLTPQCPPQANPQQFSLELTPQVTTQCTSPLNTQLNTQLVPEIDVQLAPPIAFQLIPNPTPQVVTQLTSQHHNQATIQVNNNISTHGFDPSMFQLSNLHDFWMSPESSKRFGYINPKPYQLQQSVKEIVQNRINRFFSAVHYPQKWREVLEDNDDNNKCSDTFIFHLRRKCRYLVAALTIILNSNLDHTTITINWKKACELAAQKIRNVEDCETYYNNGERINSHNKSHLWVSARTMMFWFNQFRENNESFVNHAARRHELSKDPPFFDINPDLKELFIVHA